MKLERAKDYHMALMHRNQVYPIMKRWWVAHGWPKIPLEVLPPQAAVGFLGDRMVCCTYVYEPVGCVAAWIDYHVTSPDAGMRGAIALQWLLEDVVQACRGNGKQVFHSCCRQESLGRLMERAGFERTDEGVIHFLKITE